LIANFLTLCGSSLVNIPLGIRLSQNIDIGLSFVAIFGLKLLPGVLLSPVYGYLADRYSSSKCIQYSQLLSALISILTLASISYGSLEITVIFIFLGYCASGLLKNIFPAFVSTISKKEDRAVLRNYGTWQSILGLSIMAANLVGGLLTDSMKVEWFIIIDSVTFIFCFLIWKIFSISDNLTLPPHTVVLPRKRIESYLASLNIASFFKKLPYGILNAVIPVFVIAKFNYEASTLGIAYFFFALTSIVGARLIHLIKVPFRLMFLLLWVLESVFIATTLISSSFVFYIILFSLTMVAMGAGDALMQLFFIHRGDRSYSENILSVTYRSSCDIAILIGFSLFSLFEGEARANFCLAVVWVSLVLSNFFFFNNYLKEKMTIEITPTK
jgi:MFS family permease